MDDQARTLICIGLAALAIGCFIRLYYDKHLEVRQLRQQLAEKEKEPKPAPIPIQLPMPKPQERPAAQISLVEYFEDEYFDLYVMVLIEAETQAQKLFQ